MWDNICTQLLCVTMDTRVNFLSTPQRCALIGILYLQWWRGTQAGCRSSPRSSWWWCPTSPECTQSPASPQSAPCSAGGLLSARSLPPHRSSDARREARTGLKLACQDNISNNHKIVTLAQAQLTLLYLYPLVALFHPFHFLKIWLIIPFTIHKVAYMFIYQTI